MLKMNPPLRFMIARLLADGRVRETGEILAELSPLYGRERQFSRQGLEDHLQALKVVGLVEVQDVSLDAAGGLVFRYRISPQGLKLLSRLSQG